MKQFAVDVFLALAGGYAAAFLGAPSWGAYVASLVVYALAMMGRLEEELKK